VPVRAADGALGTSDVLALSKMTGVCGVMQQMAAFQSSTKMPGGDEFIIRFWTAEFARLGKTQGQFISECESSISVYDKLWAAAAQRPK